MYRRELKGFWVIVVLWRVLVEQESEDSTKSLSPADHFTDQRYLLLGAG